MSTENPGKRINARTLAWYAADPAGCVEASRREADQPPESGFKRAVRLRPWRHAISRASNYVLWTLGLIVVLLAVLMEVRAAEANPVPGVAPIIAASSDAEGSSSVSVGLVIIGILVMVLAMIRQGLRSSNRKERICRLLDLNPRRYRLLASTLDSDGRPKLKGREEGERVVGWPEAILRTRLKRGRNHTYIVSIYKPDKQPCIRDKYEITLHMGLLQEMSRRARGKVIGLVTYGDGETVHQEFDQELYSDLCGLALEAMWSLRTGHVTDPRPLAERGGGEEVQQQAG